VLERSSLFAFAEQY